MKNIFLSICFVLLLTNVSAQAPTWNNKIANIIYNNCSNCHNEKGIGPTLLMSYDDALTSANSIKYHTQDRHMPPWKADPTYRHFIGERILSSDDVQAIADWVDAGAPKGTGTEPTPPTIKSGSQLDVLDLSVMTPAFTVVKTEDEYRTFVIKTNNSEKKYLNAIEFIPSNPAIVHHIIMYHDPSTYSRNLDSLDPGPGYESNGTGAESPSAKLIGLWTPGAGVFYLPSNMGYELPKGTDLVIELHYAPGSNAKSDSTTVNMKYTTINPVRPITAELVLYHYPPVLQSSALTIPANTIQTYNQSVNSGSKDLSLVGIFPHMHLIGKSYKIFATKGTDTTKLINIPDWQFHWQGFYTFQKLIKINKLSTIKGVAVYDNTTNNPNNPSNPPINVVAGENTKNEMMVTFLAYTPYVTGDENIILDSTLLNTGIEQSNNLFDNFKVYPIPASEMLNIQSENNSILTKIEIIDFNGKLITTASPVTSETDYQIPINHLVSGIYFIKLYTQDNCAVKKFIKSN